NGGGRRRGRPQRPRQWNLLWDTLTECAVRLDFVQLRLDVNVPILGEGYNASWSRPNGGEHNRLWRFDMPLVVDDRVLGYIKVVGGRNGAAGHNLEQLM